MTGSGGDPAEALQASWAFGRIIREAREDKTWTQDDLADRAGVSRPTINRYEQGKTKVPEPETARAIFRALGLDPRRIPVLLGYVTTDEMGLPAERPRVFAESVEEVIKILQDDTLPPAVRAEWVEYLRFRAQRARDEREQRHAG